jgi:thiamine biosynthesis protein ThiI
MTQTATCPIVIRQTPEMHLKSPRTRQRFRRLFKRNLHSALEGIPHTLHAAQGLFLLYTPEPEAALEVLPHVFGVGSFARVQAVVKGGVDEMCQAAAEHLAEAVRGRRFAVRCRRQGQKAFSTQEIERRVGAVLDGPGRVDLTTPEVVVHIDLHLDGTHLHAHRSLGAGGLPIGVQEPSLAMISGGFDSAVAAWYAMRRGSPLDFVFCNLGGAAHEHRVVQVVRLLCEQWARGIRPRLFVLDFQSLVADMRAQLAPDIWQVVLKRLMLRGGEAIARQTGAEALVTGECLSQVSSQTLSNLNTIDAATELPVLRPLIGFDKQEIMDLARTVGTFKLSEGAPEFCALSLSRPALRTRRAEIDRQEARLDAGRLHTAIKQARVLDVMNLSEADLAEPAIFVQDFPDDARVIDCQPPGRYHLWHVPGAVNYPAEQLAEGFKKLPRDEHYVLYCFRGTNAAILAERMQQAGYRAHAFRGDVSRARKIWVSRAAA